MALTGHFSMARANQENFPRVLPELPLVWHRGVCSAWLLCLSDGALLLSTMSSIPDHSQPLAIRYSLAYPPTLPLKRLQPRFFIKVRLFHLSKILPLCGLLMIVLSWPNAQTMLMGKWDIISSAKVPFTHTLLGTYLWSRGMVSILSLWNLKVAWKALQRSRKPSW